MVITWIIYFTLNAISFDEFLKTKGWTLFIFYIQIVNPSLTYPLLCGQQQKDLISTKNNPKNDVTSDLKAYE